MHNLALSGEYYLLTTVLAHLLKYELLEPEVQLNTLITMTTSFMAALPGIYRKD